MRTRKHPVKPRQQYKCKRTRCIGSETSGYGEGGQDEDRKLRRCPRLTTSSAIVACKEERRGTVESTREQDRVSILRQINTYIDTVGLAV